MMAREVELSLMFWACMRQQPVDISRVNGMHFINFVVEGFCPDRIYSFVEELFK